MEDCKSGSDMFGRQGSIPLQATGRGIGDDASGEELCIIALLASGNDGYAAVSEQSCLGTAVVYRWK